MKYAIIDTETSGLFNFKKPADDPIQPRLASATFILLDEDFCVETRQTLFVKPDGWTMPESAESKNGLTVEFLDAVGIAVVDVLQAYTEIIEGGYAIAAFNAQYDTKIMRGEMRRAGMDDLFEHTPNVCLMRACTSICKIPRKTGKGYKFPKLQEACEYFGIPYDTKVKHTSDRDAEAALGIFRKLHILGKLPEPTVHYAKNRPV
jgi:DNA polymerase III epsilon subunit-like protein